MFFLESNNNSHGIKIKLDLGDGSYDSSENFKYLQKKRRIFPAIKIRKNSNIISPINNNVRNREIRSQIRDLQMEEEKNYGKRSIIETMVFFSNNRVCWVGYVYSIQFQNMIQEMVMKVSLYNMFRRMA